MKETKNVFMSELTEVFSKRQQQFVQFAYSYVRNREEAEDIVMGAFTNVWEHRNELQEDTNISALLLTAIKSFIESFATLGGTYACRAAYRRYAAERTGFAYLDFGGL